MRISILAAFSSFALFALPAHAEPVALHFSGTIGTSLYGDVVDGNFDWSEFPNGSPFDGCVAYDSAAVPSGMSLEDQVALYYPLVGGEIVVDTVAGRFTAPAGDTVYAQAFTGPYYNGISVFVQPMEMPTDWVSPNAYVTLQLFNEVAKGQGPLAAPALPESMPVESLDYHQVILDFLSGVTTPNESTTRRIQVHAIIEASAWTSGSCSVVDSDGDGLLDPDDACPNTTELPVNANGCSVADLVPCDGVYASHRAYVIAVAKTSKTFLQQGLLTRQQRRAMMIKAAQSSCGR